MQKVLESTSCVIVLENIKIPSNSVKTDQIWSELHFKMWFPWYFRRTQRKL